MLSISDSIRIGMINGKGEARRRLGLDYVKVVPVPRTLSESIDLHRNYKSYGLTADELHEALKDGVLNR